jgi:hypothetical protein
VVALAGAGYFAWRYVHRVHPEPPPRGANIKAWPAARRESSLSIPIVVEVGLIERIVDDKVPRVLLSRQRMCRSRSSADR